MTDKLDKGLSAVTNEEGEVFLMLYGGHKYYPARPGDFTINVEDYAHSLALQCRYAGHCEFHYSVALHQILMAKHLLAATNDPVIALAGLHHDGSESVLIDVPRPIKPFLKGYFEIEAPAQKRMYELFGVPFEEPPPEVHEADNLILYNEGKVLHPFADWWEFFAPGLPNAYIVERDWREVKQEFIDYHYHLQGMCMNYGNSNS